MCAGGGETVLPCRRLAYRLPTTVDGACLAPCHGRAAGNGSGDLRHHMHPSRGSVWEELCVNSPDWTSQDWTRGRSKCLFLQLSVWFHLITVLRFSHGQHLHCHGHWWESESALVSRQLGWKTFFRLLTFKKNYSIWKFRLVQETFLPILSW